MTPLDQAFAAMQADPEDDAARLRYYDRLADTDLCLLLSEEAGPRSVTPQVFDLEGGRFVLVFDGDERLAGFVGAASPYAALPGRVIAGLLQGRGIGMGINLEGSSSLLMPAEAVTWLAEVLARVPDEVEALPEQVRALAGSIPDMVIAALTEKLAHRAGLAQAALLVAVDYAGGRPGHMLAFVGTRPGARAALAKAVGEALTFSGVDAGEIDVGFVAESDAILPALLRHGLAFDIARDAANDMAGDTAGDTAGKSADTSAIEPAARPAPGTDPEKPPILR